MTTDPDEPTLTEFLRSVQNYMALEYETTYAHLMAPTAFGVPESLAGTINRIAWDGFLDGQTAQFVCGLVAEEYRSVVGNQSEEG